MLRRILLGVILACAIGAGIFWLLTIPAVVATASIPPRTPNLANGVTTFNAGGCSSCHAVPSQPDRLKLGGGLAMPSPFGTFYVPNISPDPTYGIGRWSEADFVTAVLKGTSPDGQHYFPAFPYASYQHATVDDVRDLFAYLKTLAPVSGKTPGHDVPFPFNIRRTLGGWKFLFLDGKPFMIVKFRSMRINAEASSGPVWAIKDDPRRTRIGTFLRHWSLDELPQIWNVLMGDMSIIGPRPERPTFVREFKHKIPRYIWLLDQSLPRNANGKFLKRELREMLKVEDAG